MEEDIGLLREAFGSTFASTRGVIDFVAILAHPDLAWNDLLLGLAQPNHEIIKNQARGTLYRVLNEPSEKTDTPITDPIVWERKIRERGIDPMDKVRRA